MEELFRCILNMSVVGSIVIVMVLLLRLALRKAPRYIAYALWSVVLFRLVCPVSFGSPLALLPRVDIIPQEILTSQSPHIDSGVAIIDDAINPLIAQSMTTAPHYAATNPMQAYMYIFGLIWAAGVAAMLIYAAAAMVKLRGRIRYAIIISDNVYECESIDTPFVIGIFKSKIYVPMGITGVRLGHIIAHERAHIRRFDNAIKPLSFMVLAVHWFNPLVWLSYMLYTKDMELSCDEMVISRMSKDARQAYSQTLLSVSSSRGGIITPLAFGESNTKARVKNAINYKKPMTWVIVGAVTVAAIVGLCLIANPFPHGIATNIVEYSADPVQGEDGGQGSGAANDRHVYKVDETFKTINVSIDCWRNGVATTIYEGMRPLGTQSEREGAIMVTAGIRYDEAGAWDAFEWEIDQAVGPSKTSLTLVKGFPDGFRPSCSAATILGKEGSAKQAWDITAGKPIVLSVIVLQSDPTDVLRALDCQQLMESPQAIAEYECAYVVTCRWDDGDEGDDGALPQTPLKG